MEACNCDYLCPCIYTNSHGAVTNDNCTAIQVYRIDNGHYNGTRLDGMVVGVGENKTFRGLFRLVDRERSEAPAVTRYFRDRGIRVALLSGDRREEALRIARISGIAEEDVFAPMSPAEKRTRIQNWQREGQIVSMVGDGINDAASLAQADIGISMTNAAGLAQDKGNILLLGNTLELLVTAHEASLATMDKIRQNLGWAFLYNIVGIPMAGGVLYPFWHIFIPPYVSGLAMALSSVLVVTNSMLLSFPAPGIPQTRANGSV